MDLLRQRAPSPGALDRNIGFPACAPRRHLVCCLRSAGLKPAGRTDWNLCSTIAIRV